jgi:hypothetical protein
MPALSSFDARPFMQVADSFAIRSPVDEPDDPKILRSYRSSMTFYPLRNV